MGPFGFSIAGLVLAAMLGSATAPAAVAPQKPQAPGFYRMKLGAIEIIALSDGAVAAGTANGYLIRTGGKLVLIDTGAGTLRGPGAGKLGGNLRAAGFHPEQVDEIYITVMNPDHVGGLLLERKAVFPNATVRASRAEAGYWLTKSAVSAVPAEERQPFADVAAALKPYVVAGRLKTFDGETALVPGLRALPNGGSKPGDTAYTAESRGKKILFWGDTLHFDSAPSGDLAVAGHHAVDPAAGAPGGTVLFEDTAAHGDWVALAYLPFPGVGHLRKAPRGFEFVPGHRNVP